MELKTKVYAEDGKHDIVITREFNLPRELVFRAFTEPELIEQWMGNKVLQFEAKKHGGWHFQKKDDQGNVVFEADGVIHELTHNRKITRTFEMYNTPFGVQLEVSDFEELGEDKSKVTLHTVYETVAQRDEVLKLPFRQGINWAHNRLEEVMSKFKQQTR
ncbi:MAG: SRPBCC domain-containing protein [Bacteroidetes bacterium]|nr:SRPBCC domain-containing protein [Bacteroidota bacterium]